ncbi:MAG: MATE family efflux transporter, partial [Bacteroidia bacterium]|nr:MATE family efflux transporter [Bacteroidia bacterium]
GALLFNIFLNWVLIYGKLGFPQLGSTGCALATGISMWFMLFVMLYWVRHAKAYQATYPFNHIEKPDFSIITQILKIGIPIGLTYFIEVSAFCMIALLVAHFGVIQVSANQIALNVSSLLFMVPMSIGVAQITRVGQTLGENNLSLARYISWLGIGISLAFSSISVICIITFRHTIAAIYTSDPDVQKMAAVLLLIVGIFQFSDGLQVVAASALRGYKETFKPMVIHFLAFYLFAIPLGYILAIAPAWSTLKPNHPMGVNGYWIGLTFGLTISALLQVIYLNYYSKKRIFSADDRL